jgi:hypothetical protein
VSTVLDVAVCLLLVGAAVATLAVAPQSSDRSGTPDADATASTIATVTTTVRAGDDRRRHDTLAGLLGTAAVAAARVEGDPVVETAYPAAVETETAALTADRAFVTATWEPYPGAPVGGRVEAGEEPPANADVAATTLVVDAGVTSPGRTDSFGELARTLADAYVAWLFPPERTYARLADRRTAPRTAARYREAGDAVAVDVDEPVLEGRVRSANDDLSAALAVQLEADLRDRYATHEAAASNATIDGVEVVVRRWEP